MTETEFSRKRVIPQMTDWGYKIDSFEFSGNQSRPDLYIVDPGYGYSFWLELKVLKDKGYEFQPGQVSWIEEHIKANGKAYVLTLGENDEVLLWSGKSARWLSNADVTNPLFHQKAVGKILNVFNVESKTGWQTLCSEIRKDMLLHWGPS